ncbi:hypothetical protein FQN50_002855 [Emmonsiellopsis sp. PD_5]|nr:hypothetical protein FQN50_002855 [Emmonsiellopsis sp. PD_5]
MSTRRSLRSRASLADASSSTPSNIMTRTRRTTDGITSSPSITVSRSSPTPPEDKRSIRLTVKMPSSKLREVTSEKRHHNIFTEPVIVTGPRNSRTKKKLVEVDTDDDEDLESPEEEEEEEEDQLSDEDAEASDEEDNANGESEDEDADADGDIDMDDAPPVAPKQAAARPTVTVTPAGDSRSKNTSASNMDLDDDDDDDEELSELDSEADAEGEPEEEIPVSEEIVEDEEVEEEDEEDEQDELESDIGTPITGSRASTPDIAKMTKRQRGRMELGGDFLQLPMEPQIKKHLTAEEHAMRRAEMARRRKNLSEKRNEEEKMDTINKLLKKQAPKRRGKISAAETAAGAGDTTPRTQEPQEPEKAEPTMIRYVSNRDGCRVGVPDEWFGTPAGRIFGNATKGSMGASNRGQRLVEEV